MARLDMLLNTKEGEFDFRIENELLFNEEQILSSRAHNTYAKLELNNQNGELVYTHIYEDQWEREGKIDLRGLEDYERFYINLIWSPEENELQIAPMEDTTAMRKQKIK